LVLLAVAGVTLLLGIHPPADGTTAPPGDELLVVDCLLPGQIRRLGQRTTYVSARRPLKTTARDCQIRGGEYAAYDRASLQTSLAVWLPAANEGDAEASTIVGEIFERGLGSVPDFAAAAQWYRRGSEQGSTRAQINLGHLYEKGLGVARDPAEALRWYRRAAGLGTGIELDPGDDPGRTENAELRREVERLQSEAHSLNAELERMRRELEDERRPEAAPVNPPPVAPPEPGTQTAPGAPISPAPQIQAELDVLRLELARGNTEVQQLNQLLAQSAESLAASQAELQRARREHAERLTELARSNVALDEQRRAATEGTARLAALEAALAQREVEAQRQRTEAERLRTELTALQAQMARQSTLLDSLVEPVVVTAQADTAGPDISIIEPQLLGTRGITVVAAAAAASASREIVGRVTAPAGLLALTVNEERIPPNEHGVFTAPVKLMAPETRVSVVALDRQGKRAVVEFALRTSSSSPVPATSPTAWGAAAFASVDFGRYHALVIGNNDYRHLRDLHSAVGDARAVASVLERRYGFQVRVLTNADRYATLSALNELREQLSSGDNLLIYYAGHGILDEVNNRGHWLPVDAEAESSANWIPTTAITDVLNIMKARQVLVVADSCYAGALTRSSLARLSTATTTEERAQWLRTVSGKRARIVLTSGGVAPVLDSGGGEHSVFARALLDVLNSNVEVLDGQRLSREVAARVSYAADNVGFEQVPEYAPIRYAGHEAGEFFFVPR
jgi:hypothetical protein